MASSRALRHAWSGGDPWDAWLGGEPWEAWSGGEPWDTWSGGTLSQAGSRATVMRKSPPFGMALHVNSFLSGP